jgi:ribosomal protein S18 acetylase RimI-like enzyme
MREAFAEYEGILAVPSSAHGESVDDVRSAMQRGGAVLAFWEGNVAGSARYRVDPDVLYVGRVSVLPAYRRRGVARAMMRFLEQLGPTVERDRVRVIARESLPGNVELYRALGYRVVKIAPHPRGPDRECWMEQQLPGRQPS